MNNRNAAQPNSGTRFATAERASTAELQEMVDYCLQNPATQAILAAVDGYVLILNEQRQILAVNQSVLKDLNISEVKDLIGLRPGEAFGCIHCNDSPTGCGTSINCSACGVVISILSSQILNQSTSGECLMSVRREGNFEAHEFTVRTTPLQIANTTLRILVLHDISSAKRRDVMENIFIHDFYNVITGLRGWSEVLVKQPQDASNIAQGIINLSTVLTQEVDYHRLLLQAESGELQVSLVCVPVSDILDGLRSFFSGYPPDIVRRLVIREYEQNAIVQTCLTLLVRILANMVKNALEATGPSDLVHVRFKDQIDTVCFEVHNPGEVSEAEELQMFKRSFSTKSTHGRGLGTYSMKLFGEKFLGGKVGFETSKEEGTSFYINLPCKN